MPGVGGENGSTAVDSMDTFRKGEVDLRSTNQVDNTSLRSTQGADWTDADQQKLMIMVEEEGLDYVEEQRLKQDKTSVYTGYLDRSNKRKGWGRKVFKNGDKYEGEWSNDKANGKGRYEHADGDVYKGFWKDDKAHGYGLYTSSSGSSYLGDW